METSSAIPLVIIGSARKQGTTYAVTDSILRDIKVKILDLANHTIAPYNYEGDYGEDDFMDIAGQMLKHDTIIFATPVYWYAMSGIMKTFFDRFTDLVTVQKQMGRQLKGKNFLLIATGTEIELPEGFEVPFKRTIEYFDATYNGVLYFRTKEKYPDTHPAEATAFRNKLLAL